MSEKRYRIGIIGEGSFLETAIRAWMAGGQLESLAVCDRSEMRSIQYGEGIDCFEDEFEMLASVELDALELASGRGVAGAVFESAIKIGLPLLVSGAFAGNYQTALSLAAAVSTMRAPFAYLDSLLEHPFVNRALRELERESIGEIQMLRVKANAGFIDSFENSDGAAANPLLRREFDRTALVEKLFGPVTELFCQSGKNAWLLSYRFAAPGRYGFLEAVMSPDLRFNADFPPIDDSVEITGTDGIILLRNLSGLLCEAPRFSMKRRDETVILDDRIEYSLESRELDMRLRFIENMHKKGVTPFDATPVLRAARLAEAARISALESRPVRPEEISPHQK